MKLNNRYVKNILDLEKQYPLHQPTTVRIDNNEYVIDCYWYRYYNKNFINIKIKKLDNNKITKPYVIVATLSKVIYRYSSKEPWDIILFETEDKYYNFIFNVIRNVIKISKLTEQYSVEKHEFESNIKLIMVKNLK